MNTWISNCTYIWVRLNEIQYTLTPIQLVLRQATFIYVHFFTINIAPNYLIWIFHIKQVLFLCFWTIKSNPTIKILQETRYNLHVSSEIGIRIFLYQFPLCFLIIFFQCSRSNRSGRLGWNKHHEIEGCVSLLLALLSGERDTVAVYSFLYPIYVSIRMRLMAL